MRLIILGATGSLGRHVLRAALDAGHDVSVLVRDATRLPDGARDRVAIHSGDLFAGVPADLLAGQDALINCAGHIADGERFAQLVDRVVSSAEYVEGTKPVCWFLAGAALLDLDVSGRRGVELPKLKSTYWPHRTNFQRLARSSLDWRLLCPGPMVEGPPLGLEKLRISTEHLPVEMPALARALPGALVLPFFAALIPQMIVPYADAAALMLANLERGGAMARCRVGIALPAGMRGRKARWTPQTQKEMP